MIFQFLPIISLAIFSQLREIRLLSASGSIDYLSGTLIVADRKPPGEGYLEMTGYAEPVGRWVDFTEAT